MNSQDFENYLHPEALKILKIINSEGYTPSLVGGVVRDYYLKRKISHDYDCEIRVGKEGELSLSRLVETLEKKKYKIEKLKFNIYRIKESEFEFEFTLPREEKFSNNFDHSNISVKQVRDPEYKTSKRRDFTLNAIYAEFDDGSFKVVDPLNGLKSIENKELVACSEKFAKDPVRILRLIRFHLLLGFSYKIKIPGFSIEDYPAFYLKYEMAKSLKPYEFISILRKEKINNDLVVYQDVFNGDLSEFFNYIPFLDKSYKLRISKALDLSLKKINEFTEPLELKKKFDKRESLVRSYKFLDRLPENIFKIYKKLNLIDIDYDQFQTVKAFKDFDTKLKAEEIYYKKFASIF